MDAITSGPQRGPVNENPLAAFTGRVRGVLGATEPWETELSSGGVSWTLGDHWGLCHHGSWTNKNSFGPCGPSPFCVFSLPRPEGIPRCPYVSSMPWD